MVAIYPDLTDGLGGFLLASFVFGFGDIFLTPEARDGWLDRYIVGWEERDV